MTLSRSPMPPRKKPLRNTTPLEPGGPLPRRTEWRRKTPMGRGGGPSRSPHPSPSKAARDAAEREAERWTKEIAWARSGGVCELGAPGWCEGRATNLSHRLAAGVGGLWAPSNGLYACGMGNATGCHGFVHQRGPEARERGWRLERRCRDDPLAVPVKHARFGWVLLDDEGGVAPSELRPPWEGTACR